MLTHKFMLEIQLVSEHTKQTHLNACFNMKFDYFRASHEDNKVKKEVFPSDTKTNKRYKPLISRNILRGTNGHTPGISASCCLQLNMLLCSDCSYHHRHCHPRDCNGLSQILNHTTEYETEWRPKQAHKNPYKEHPYLLVYESYGFSMSPLSMAQQLFLPPRP